MAAILKTNLSFIPFRHESETTQKIASSRDINKTLYIKAGLSVLFPTRKTYDIALRCTVDHCKYYYFAKIAWYTA